jgi:hypothetical protein
MVSISISTSAPINPDGWTSIDKSLDRALKHVRTGSRDLAACTEALSSLSMKIDRQSTR